MDARPLMTYTCFVLHLLDALCVHIYNLSNRHLCCKDRGPACVARSAFSPQAGAVIGKICSPPDSDFLTLAKSCVTSKKSHSSTTVRSSASRAYTGLPCRLCSHSRRWTIPPDVHIPIECVLRNVHEILFILGGALYQVPTLCYWITTCTARQIDLAVYCTCSSIIAPRLFCALTKAALA